MGLKREAGENPAWSRHCNWRELVRSRVEATGPLARAGKEAKFAKSQKPGDLPSGIGRIRFAERCTGT